MSFDAEMKLRKRHFNEARAAGQTFEAWLIGECAQLAAGPVRDHLKRALAMIEELINEQRTGVRYGEQGSALRLEQLTELRTLIANAEKLASVLPDNSPDKMEASS
jgi:hypothetical protein